MKKLIATLILALFASVNIWAQGCVTCTNTAAQLGQDSAKGLNNGILYLVLIPFAFVGTVAFVMYKINKADKLAESEG